MVGIPLFGLLISVAFAPETPGMSLAQTSYTTIVVEKWYNCSDFSLF